MNIIEKIESSFPELSISQQKVGRYILENMEEVVVCSAQKIADASQVSEATVHRFSKKLGYESFSTLKESIHEFTRNDNRALNNLLSKTSSKPDSWLEKHFTQEADNIAETSKEVTQEAIYQAANLFLQANQIWLAGWRLGLSITSHMQFTLKYMLGNSVFVPQGEVAEYAAHFKKGDILFVSAFPRYDTRTMRLVQLAREKGLNVIVLTDSNLCPACQVADLNLYAKTKSTGFLDSYTAALSVCHAIISEISYIGGDRIKHTIEEMEHFYAVFGESSRK